MTRSACIREAIRQVLLRHGDSDEARHQYEHLAHLEPPELERAAARLEMEAPLVRIAVDPSLRHKQGIGLIRQPERSAIQL
jgi:hypothetical protein